MIWFLLLLSLLFAGVDFLFYRVRMRGHSERLRHAFVWFAVFSDALPIVVVMLLKAVPDNTTGWMQAAQWFTFVFLLLIGCRYGYYFGLLFDRHRGFSRVGVLFAAGWAVWLVWGAAWGRQALRVNEVEIRSAALPAAFDGFRIVQFSDLHIGTLVRPEREMNRLVDTINALRPDLVVFSGDLVNVRSTELTSDVLAILRRLRAPYGVISTLGNHDVGLYIKDTVALPRAENNRQVIDRQRKIGWRMLLDSTLYLRRGSDSISVTGISFDPTLQKFRHSFDLPEISLATAYEGMPEGMFNLTVSHLPQLWPNITALGRGNLTLAGHVHSMQIKGHLFGRAFSPAQLMYDRWSGRYDDAAGNTLYINDGIGYVGFPMRLGADPEITLFTLKNESDRFHRRFCGRISGRPFARPPDPLHARRLGRSASPPGRLRRYSGRGRNHPAGQSLAAGRRRSSSSGTNRPGAFTRSGQGNADRFVPALAGGQILHPGRSGKDRLHHLPRPRFPAAGGDGDTRRRDHGCSDRYRT